MTNVEVTLAQIKSFFSMYAEMVAAGDDKLTINKLEMEGDVQIAHHHIKTGMMMSNRSFIVGYYTTEGANGEFTFCVSTVGNESLLEKYQSMIGKDVVGRLENVVCFTPVDGKYTVKQCLIADAGGSIPDMLKKKMLKKQSDAIQMLISKIKAVKA